MVQLKFYGFVFCFQTFGFLVFLRLHYGVITWLLLIYQSIFFFMPTLNMSRLQLIRRFKFTSFLPRISLVMFLLNLYLLRSLFVFYPSFMWELYFQLEMAYYKKYTARSYDTIQEIIFILYNLYLKSCVGCHIVNIVHNLIYINRNYD